MLYFVFSGAWQVASGSIFTSFGCCFVSFGLHCSLWASLFPLGSFWLTLRISISVLPIFLRTLPNPLCVLPGFLSASVPSHTDRHALDSGQDSSVFHLVSTTFHRVKLFPVSSGIVRFPLDSRFYPQVSLGLLGTFTELSWSKSGTPA